MYISDSNIYNAYEFQKGINIRIGDFDIKTHCILVSLELIAFQNISIKCNKCLVIISVKPLIF